MNKEGHNESGAPPSDPFAAKGASAPSAGEAALLATLDSFREAQLRLENRWLHQQLEEAKRALRVRNN